VRLSGLELAGVRIKRNSTEVFPFGGRQWDENALLPFFWMLFALWRTARPTPVALTAGAALTALGAIAAVGNALSFTTVSVGAGLLAGLATARPIAGVPSPRELDAPARGERPIS